jgi:glycolate oxidase iron-sulfur subunit
MQSEKYHLSRQAGQSRAAQINAVDASCVGSECSACKMQLNNALHIHGSSTKCANPIELIANAL